MLDSDQKVNDHDISVYMVNENNKIIILNAIEKAEDDAKKISKYITGIYTTLCIKTDHIRCEITEIVEDLSDYFKLELERYKWKQNGSWLYYHENPVNAEMFWTKIFIDKFRKYNNTPSIKLKKNNESVFIEIIFNPLPIEM